MKIFNGQVVRCLWQRREPVKELECRVKAESAVGEFGHLLLEVAKRNPFSIEAR